MESLFSKSNGPSAYDMIIAPTSDLGQKRASPAGAMRLLFGAAKIEVMPVNRTALRIMAGLRVRAESRARTPKDTNGKADRSRMALSTLLPC